MYPVRWYNNVGDVEGISLRWFRAFFLAVVACTALSAGEAVEKTPLDVIREHVAELEGQTVFVDFMGRPTRAKFKSVSDEALTVMVAGGEVPIPLSTMETKRLLSIAKKVASGSEFLGLIRHFHKKGEAEMCDVLLEEAATRFPEIGAELRALQDEISPPPPQPEEKPEEQKDKPVRRPASRSYPALPPSKWACMGPGGGGAMYTPTISPHDPKVGIINCDMGGVYLTRDGGVNWHILPMNLGHGVAFSPTDPNVMFVGCSGKMFRSADGGVNWTAVTPDKQFPMCSVWSVLADPDDGRCYWITYGRGALEAGHAVQGGNTMTIGFSINGGTSFADVARGFPQGNGMVVELALDRGSPVGSRTLFAATTGGGVQVPRRRQVVGESGRPGPSPAEPP